MLDGTNPSSPFYAYDVVYHETETVKRQVLYQDPKEVNTPINIQRQVDSMADRKGYILMNLGEPAYFYY